MADDGMVALRDALGKILQSEHADLLREGVGLVVGEVMELEASACGEAAPSAAWEKASGEGSAANQRPTGSSGAGSGVRSRGAPSISNAR